MYLSSRIYTQKQGDKRVADSDNYNSRCAERFSQAKNTHLLMLAMVMGALLSLGWLSDSGPKGEKLSSKGLHVIMQADSDTLALSMPPIDFDLLFPYEGEGDVLEIICECPPYSRTSWITPPYWPKPLNYDAVKAQIAYPPMLQEAGIYDWVIFQVLVDPAGNYLAHEAKEGHLLALSEIEQYLPQLEFSSNPMSFDVSPLWVDVYFYFKPSPELNPSP